MKLRSTVTLSISNTWLARVLTDGLPKNALTSPSTTSSATTPDTRRYSKRRGLRGEGCPNSGYSLSHCDGGSVIPRTWGSATCLRTRTAQVVSFVLGVLIGSPAAAQIPVIIRGRVQDAVSGEAVGRALVIAGDSTNAVFADSLGDFWISLNSTPPYVVLPIY